MSFAKGEADSETQPENADASNADLKHMTTYQQALELGSRVIEFDEKANKRLLRKIDRLLMPLMCVTYALQFYDKALLGQAAIFGLRKDTGLVGYDLRYSNVSMIFYCGYIVGCYPASYLAQKYPTGKVCAALCFVWSVVIMSTAGCNSFAGLMVNRFVLGVIESGISPSFMLVTSMWYTHQEQIQRAGFWYSCSGGSNLISPLINYGLGSITGGTIHPWQYMYLVAGGATFLWSFVIWVWFPNSPVSARGFTDDEKAMVLQRTRANNQGAVNSKLKLYQVKEAILGYQFWMICALSCLVSIAAGPITAFGSIIINGFGFDVFESLLLNMPIGVFALICINGSAYLGRRFRDARLYILAAACIPVITGCVLILKLPATTVAGRLIGFYLLNFFSASYVHCISIGTSNFAGSTKQTTVAAGVFVSYCVGNIIGPLVFSANDAPNYEPGFIITCSCVGAAFVIALSLRFLLLRENRRRDEVYGQAGTEHGLEDMTDMENKDFRYHL